MTNEAMKLARRIRVLQCLFLRRRRRREPSTRNRDETALVLVVLIFHSGALVQVRSTSTQCAMIKDHSLIVLRGCADLFWLLGKTRLGI